VVENAQCTNRSRCLCPDTSAGQTRDNFVNIVVYGPRTLPEQGPVQIPVLPADGNIVTLNMHIETDAVDEVPLHVFSAIGTPAKPTFGANLSIGDQAACDVTANNSNRSNVLIQDGVVTAGPAGTPSPTPTGGCVGDCNGDGMVAINEIITGVNVLPANGEEAADAVTLIQQEQQAQANKVEGLSMDGIGYNGPVLRELTNPQGLNLDVTVPPQSPRERTTFPTERFSLTVLEDGTRVLTCPAGHHESGRRAVKRRQRGTIHFVGNDDVVHRLLELQAAAERRDFAWWCVASLSMQMPRVRLESGAGEQVP